VTDTIVEEPEQFLPDCPNVCAKYDITRGTLYRWDHDPNLNFPPKVMIRGRGHRSRRMLDDFDQRLVREAIARKSEKLQARQERRGHKKARGK
jgi:predicted DNA-binding transcriptional regulator AlpA